MLRQIYGKVLHRETLDTDDLANHIMSHGTLYTDDVVLGVTRKLMRCIAELLTEGYKVKLDGIGTLYLAATSTGSDTYEDFDISKNITRIGVKFTADQSNDSLYTARMMRKNTSLTTKIGNSKVTFGEQEGSGSGGNERQAEEQLRKSLNLVESGEFRVCYRNGRHPERWQIL